MLERNEKLLKALNRLVGDHRQWYLEEKGFSITDDYDALKSAIERIDKIDSTPVQVMCRSRGRTKAMIEELVKHPYVYVTCTEDATKSKAFDILKRNLMFSYDNSPPDLPSAVVGVRIAPDNLVIIFETHDEYEIGILKGALQ